jgi:hypothetical protein
MTEDEQRKPMPMARPRPERLVQGEAQPERPVDSGRTEDTADLEGIEIDNAIERPQEGQPGQPGAKTS